MNAIPQQQIQFLAWAHEVPYLVDFIRQGFGVFDLFRFRRADDDFSGTLADVPRILPADPADVAAAGGPAAYIEAALSACIQ
jgi:hypothetical protein